MRRVDYLIKNGRVIDPASGFDGTADVAISGGRVSAIGKELNAPARRTIDARGKIVAPGLVDMHVHVREPGREDKETVRTGTRAAARGGFAAIACMPNTEPPLDDAGRVRSLAAIIGRDALVKVFVIAATTTGRLGKALTDFGGMKRSGAIGVSDDGSSIDNPKIFSKALKEAKRHSLLLMEHCEDTALSAHGVMNRGFTATKMGLRGISNASEYERVKRNIALAKKASSPIHIMHVSCAETVELIRKAKRDKVRISAETAPHHFALTEECCVTYDTNTKMNPPLRARADVEAVKEGLRDGTIDAIATDHAPHTDAEKDVEFDNAPFGIIGIETALSVAAMELVGGAVLSWPQLIAKMSFNPARLLGVGCGALAQGAAADIVVIDPAREYVYTKESIESRSKNSPFINWRLKARAIHLFIGGALIMEEETIRDG